MMISMVSDVSLAKKFATADEARQYINGASCSFAVEREEESWVCRWSYDYLTEIEAGQRLYKKGS